MLLFFAVAIAFFITFILLPVIIKGAKAIDLLDTPDRRKLHDVGIPSLGGVGIFLGFFLAAIISISFNELAELKFFFAGIVLIFILGVRDDVSSLQAKHKLAIQILSAVLVVYFADIKLTGLYGIFGIENLPMGLSEVLTVFMIVVLTNSFNLIDGIDGLAGSIGVVILILFGVIFFETNFLSHSIICFSVTGSIMAFLFFNWYPSKVFMGDTGSMLLGFIISVLSVVFINSINTTEIISGFQLGSPVALSIAALIIPIYDTFRVFIIRFSNGTSPLAPDRNHIHHAVLNLGLNHAQATLSLVGVNVCVILFSFFLNGVLGNVTLILLQMAIISSFGFFVDFLSKRKKHLGLSSKVKTPKPLFISKSA